MKNGLKRFKKFVIIGLILALTMTTLAGCSGKTSEPAKADESKGTVNIGMVNWAECVAVSNLWKVILEDQGYDVELTQLDAAPLYVGLDKGDLDLFLDSWLPVTHESYWNEYKDNLDDYGTWYQADAKVGIVVPQYVDITTIEEMAASKDKFNGEIIGIDPGAGIMKAANAANEDYGLGFDVIQGSEAAMMAAFEKAYKNKEWIAITGWSPHWMFAKYDVKYLEDSKLSFGEAEELHALANKNFTVENPEVAAMIKNFAMTDADIGSLEALIVEGMDPQEAAVKWIAENEETINSWM
ncbi:MAG: glycine betaine ABC transporter substrate-binding protein [Peptostreptococcaceae bacterium]|nr:glycine betaine ABC transporter substrate-binding protein [Peptostreptococcaceae bacterium]